MTEIDVYLGLLDCIHESTFLATEYDDAEEENDYGEDKAIEEAPPVHFADASEHVAEVGEDALKWIALEEQCQGTVSRNSYRIDDWSRVHPKLHTEGHKIVKISILDRKRGNDKTTTKAHQCKEKE